MMEKYIQLAKELNMVDAMIVSPKSNLFRYSGDSEMSMGM